MTETRRIRATTGCRVVNPATGEVLSHEDSKAVAWNSFWERRLLEGSIEVVRQSSKAGGGGDSPSSKPKKPRDSSQ